VRGKLAWLKNPLRMKALAGLVLALVVGAAAWSVITPGDGYGRREEPGAPAADKAQPVKDGGLLTMGFYCEDYPGDGSSLASLERNIDSLDWVSPFWYSIDASGKVNNRGGERGPAIELARDRGVKVLGLFNNQRGTDAFLQQPSIMAAAVENVVYTVEAEGLDGVNIDFEGLEPDSREGLNRFMAELYPLLHRMGKVVTVSVSPKWSGDGPADAWSYAHDYRGLSAASDYLVIMTYDQHGAWGGPGPVASRDWVSGVLEYALETVPANQVLLGIAGYGYDWGGGGASPVPARDAAALAQRWGAEVTRDDTSGAPNFVYYNRGTRHQVWWEDAESVSNKVDLARAEGLAGIALWRLGQEEPRLWSVL
jgi:spore germination protein YaaH